MAKRATDGTCLAALVKMAIPLCRAAQRQCPRTGPGRPPDYEDWRMAVFIMVAVLQKRKTKSAQYRWLFEHRRALQAFLALERFPSRSTYFERYRSVHRLFKIAIKLQGRKAIEEKVVDARVVAVDKSLVTARGPIWHRGERRRHCVPSGRRGVDRDSDFGYSGYHGWVQGYSYEVVVTATKGAVVFPLLASLDRASASEHVTFASKIDDLPASIRAAVGDAGYDNNRFGDRIEYDAHGHRSGRRWVCPLQPRAHAAAPGKQRAGARERARLRRARRFAFYQSEQGRRLYARRAQSVEPFNEWFKRLFDLNEQAWHRGLENNRTQFSAAIFAYQLLVRYNHRLGNENGQLQWLLDAI